MTIEPPNPEPETVESGDTEYATPPPTEIQEHTPLLDSADIPKRIGQYRIKRAIASGGMGTVYEALQEKPRRTVALKLMRAGIASRSALRRFEYESQLLARLRHPGIAQVYDAGTHRDGDVTVPYFAMEYIVGAKPVTVYAKEKKLGTRERMKLFTEVCEAVHHGHQKGIIHRDLKPSNILVDSSGQVKIIDFGVARCTDSDMAVTTLQTNVGQLLGTLQYMSPEQCAADPHDIDTRSDVYALGVVFYELLCERLPYDIKGAAIHEATRVIREQEPTKLSTYNRTLRGDVETIALKALEKDRDRRYRSCIELSDDLGRYLRNEPISARPASAMYQLKKLLSRHKAPFASIGVLFLLIIVFGIWMSVMYSKAEQLRQNAVAARDTLEIVTEFQQSMLSDIDAEEMGKGIVATAREAIRERMEGEGAEPDAMEAALASFDELLAKINATNLALKVIDEHVLARAVETVDKEFADQLVTGAAMQQTVATTYVAIGLYERAMHLQEACLRTRRTELGDDHLDTLRSIHDMGALFWRTGKHAEAEPYWREVLQGRRRVLGDDHADTLHSINDMGTLLNSMGKYTDAEPYHREALAGTRRVLGDDHRETLLSINNMGALLDSMGKYTDAEPYYREAVEGYRRVLGDEHSETLNSMNNMADLLRKMGKLSEAEPYSREVLESTRRVLGDDHPSTLSAINNMGCLLQNMGKYGEAEPYFREALESNRRVLGDEHPSTLNSMNNMGWLLGSMGKFADAEPYYREAVEGYRRVLGSDHRKTLGSINGLGNLLRKMGKLSEAEPYSREALESNRRVLGDDHPSTLSAINNMGCLLDSMGKFADAEPYYREAVEGYRRVLGSDHQKTLSSIQNMGRMLQLTGKYVEAEPLLLTLHKLINNNGQSSAKQKQESIERIITLYESWNAAEPGKGYDAKAAEWRAKLPKEDEAEPAKP